MDASLGLLDNLQVGGDQRTVATGMCSVNERIKL